MNLRTLAVVLAAPLLAFAQDPAIDAHQLPRPKPLSVDESVRTLKLHPGLRIEAAASEPNVCSPVGVAFDADARMYVIEMRDYPDLREQKLGRVRLLESTKGDGVFDKATVFADGLQWPTQACCWDGGVFVCASPDILYLKDTNDDGVADVRRVVFTGFGNKLQRLNVQGLVNGLTFAPDGRIYGTTSENGGVVTCPEHPEISFDLRGKGFSFDPRKLDLRAENGGGQHGISFDDAGRQYVCSNAHQIQTFAYDARYASRNPAFAMPAAMVDVGVDGPSAEVFRISPEEPWRVIRTQWRKGGLVTGPVEGGGRASGYFTSASGITIYRGDVLSDEYRGNAFIAEPAGNLVSRKVLTADGTSVKAQRAAEEKNVEFLASPDLFFRPVAFANGPDGALYVVDMYREVIEHPWSLPDSMRNLLDLHSGSDRGRIWRIVPDGYKARLLPKLGGASTEGLIKLLDSPDGWSQDTAARLLVERRDPAAVALLTHAATTLRSASGRRVALELLAALGGAHDDNLFVAMRDTDPSVRRTAVRLSEPQLANGSEVLLGAVRQLADDPSPAVRLQVAFTIGFALDADRLATLAKIARLDAGDPLARAAIGSSAIGNEAALCAALAAEPEAAELVRQLAGAAGAGPEAAVVETLAADRFREGERATAFALLAAIRDGRRRAHADVGTAGDEILKAAGVTLTTAGDERTRVAAVTLLGTTDFGRSGAALLGLLNPRESQAVQSAALAALARFDAPPLGAALVDRFGTLSPRLRSEALGVLLQRPDRVRAVLDGLSHGTLQPNDIPSPQASLLRSYRDPAIRAEARKLLAAPTGGRDEVVRAFQSALTLPGDAAKGKVVYEQRCISCHRLAGEGSAVGPDLTTVRAGGKEKMLVNILDPNREVAPNYLAYVVETRSGDSLSGIIANESAASLTVRQSFGLETVVLRSDVKRMESQKLSLMPEGLEAGLAAQDFASLLEFLATATQ